MQKSLKTFFPSGVNILIVILIDFLTSLEKNKNLDYYFQIKLKLQK